MEENKNNFDFEDQNDNTTIDTNSNDEFVIGKGFDLSIGEEEVTQKKNKKPKKKKGSGTIKSIIWILSIVIVSVSLAIGIIYAGADLLGQCPGQRGGPAAFAACRGARRHG